MWPSIGRDMAEGGMWGLGLELPGRREGWERRWGAA
ncbi:hypothetical protein E2C01_100147 [Portunus trituberculatus]|uniref:Uncharacterized protein n=1 Tax=Portunus trituberculatus TaxID=210409 RepID=A0A5B7KC86_PORTR|nr:hypothetical protein [Portunus trituberculatus]